MLWNYIKESTLRHHNRLVCEENVQLSFEDLIVYAEVLAKRLHGIRCCAILCHSEMAAAMALLGCFASHVTALPLSMRYGALHCNKILDLIKPDAVLTDENGELEIVRLCDSSYTPPKAHAALIMCTSGTTGTPKGIMLSEKNVLTNLRDIAEYFAIEQRDTILISRPLYHCAVLTGEFLVALVNGASIRFSCGPFNPSHILKMIQKHRITAFCGTPTLLTMMTQLKKGAKLESLRHICISGECMGKKTGLAIANAFCGCDVYHLYGLTEASPRVSYLPPRLFRSYPDCVGIPLHSVSIKILDMQGRACVAGQEGLLYVKGDNVMLGYYQDAKKTASVLKGGWLCTGDIALINDVGLLKIKGRNDDLIIKSGMNIYPAEIEAAVRADARVKEVLVYGFENRFGKQIGMKVVGDFATPEEVKKACSEHLPIFQVPSAVEIVSELPKSGSGKVIRRKA